MTYIQALHLPFILRRKKEGKTNYIDNDIVKNDSSPEILLQRLFVNNLEICKKYDVFISHNSADENYVIDIYKDFNKHGLVAYVDWVGINTIKKRTWCNVSTSKVIKERIHQCQCVVYIWSEKHIRSQWCPWELGYADALGKPICILGLINESNIPLFYLSYPKLIKSNGEYFIMSNGKVSFVDWLKTGSTLLEPWDLKPYTLNSIIERRNLMKILFVSPELTMSDYYCAKEFLEVCEVENYTLDCAIIKNESQINAAIGNLKGLTLLIMFNNKDNNYSDAIKKLITKAKESKFSYLVNSHEMQENQLS